MKAFLKKIQTAVLLISVMALLIACGLYIYMFMSTSAIAEKALAAQNKIAAENRDQSTGQGVLALSDATKDDRDKLRGLFVPVEDAVTFIQAIEAVGAVTGAPIKISSISAENADKPSAGAIGKISARITVSGSWQAVMRTLEMMETLPYLSIVDRTSLATATAPESGSSDGTWQLGLDITASTLSGMPKPDTASTTSANTP